MKKVYLISDSMRTDGRRGGTSIYRRSNGKSVVETVQKGFIGIDVCTDMQISVSCQIMNLWLMMAVAM